MVRLEFIYHLLGGVFFFQLFDVCVSYVCVCFLLISFCVVLHVYFTFSSVLVWLST